MAASSLLNFKFDTIHYSNYQIHLNLIIFQTFGWDLYIIRAICWLSKQPVFSNNLLKKVSSLPISLHASQPIGSSRSCYLCWKSILLFIEIVLLFQPCFHCCANFNFHHLTTSCINGLDFVSVVFRQLVNCSVNLISACFMDCLTLLETK